MTAVSDEHCRRPGSSACGTGTAERTMWWCWPGTSSCRRACGCWVTEVEAAPGGVFTGVRLPAEEPRASGGDVVLRLAAGPGRLPGLPDGHVQVYAVMAGTLVLVGEWGIAGPVTGRRWSG